MLKIKVKTVYIALFVLAIFLIPMIELGFDWPISRPNISKIDTPSAVMGTKLSASLALTDLTVAGEASESGSVDNLSFGAGAVIDEVAVRSEGELEDSSGEESCSFGVLSFKILDQTTGMVNEVSLRDYVRGAVAAEMPATFHTEALKAQAVAAHTYALHNRLAQVKSSDSNLKGADFSADPGNRRGYMTENTAKEFFGGGEAADLYWNKICEAADSVIGYVMEYQGEPIVAAYHAISAGRTEDASNVWLGEAPYLIPVKSEGCLLAPGYETVVTMEVEEVRRILKTKYPKIDLSIDPGYWFTAVERSDSGYITYADVGGVELSGKDIREIFGLRSHNIDIETDGQNMNFYVYGYGHGVGLSQYGANHLAHQGYTFDEILDNYYSGVTIRQASFEGN